MSTEHQDQPAESPRPNALARRKSPAMTAMLRRVVPDTAAVEGDGVSRLDVCAFNSSI